MSVYKLKHTGAELDAACDNAALLGAADKAGRVKLSDATNASSAAADGVAATPKAVKAAYDLAAAGKAKTRTQVIRTLFTSSYGGNTYYAAYNFPNEYKNTPGLTVSKVSIDGLTVQSYSVSSLSTAFFAVAVKASSSAYAVGIGEIIFTVTSKD